MGEGWRRRDRGTGVSGRAGSHQGRLLVRQHDRHSLLRSTSFSSSHTGDVLVFRSAPAGASIRRRPRSPSSSSTSAPYSLSSADLSSSANPFHHSFLRSANFRPRSRSRRVPTKLKRSPSRQASFFFRFQEWASQLLISATSVPAILKSPHSRRSSWSPNGARYTKSMRKSNRKSSKPRQPGTNYSIPLRLYKVNQLSQVPEVGEDSASPYSDTESARQPNFSRPLKHDQRVPRFLGRHVVTPPYHSPASTVRSISFGSLEERHGSAYTVSRNRPINFSRPPSIPPRTVSLLDGAFESFSSTPTSLSRASSFESVPVHLRIRQQSSDPLYVGLNQESRVQRPPTDNSSEAEQRSLRSTRILTVESPSSFTRPHQTPFTGPYAYDQSTEMHTIGYRRQPAKPLQPRRIPIFTARAVYPPSMAANALVRDYSAETVYGGSEAGDNVANPEEHLYHHVAGASFTARPGALQRATGGTIVSSPAADPASASALAEFPAVDLMVGVVNMDHDEFRACLDGAGPAHPNPAASSVPLRSDEPKRGPCRRLLAAVCPCVG